MNKVISYFFYCIVFINLRLIGMNLSDRQELDITLSPDCPLYVRTPRYFKIDVKQYKLGIEVFEIMNTISLLKQDGTSFVSKLEIPGRSGLESSLLERLESFLAGKSRSKSDYLRSMDWIRPQGTPEFIEDDPDKEERYERLKQFKSAQVNKVLLFAFLPQELRLMLEKFIVRHQSSVTHEGLENHKQFVVYQTLSRPSIRYFFGPASSCTLQFIPRFVAILLDKKYSNEPQALARIFYYITSRNGRIEGVVHGTSLTSYDEASTTNHFLLLDYIERQLHARGCHKLYIRSPHPDTTELYKKLNYSPLSLTEQEYTYYENDVLVKRLPKKESDKGVL